jgi:crotonobetainyl-CoA:carnitine CoA-transferase CaiB-like acyl-CoA transferase
MTGPRASSSAPLAGIKVLEIANFLAGPVGAALMSDMGAEVVKIEPPAGDTTRGMVLQGDGTKAFNHSFHALNRGKRSITLDLARPEAKEIVLRLMADADVVVTNLMTVRLDRYGINFEAARERNPDIVFAQVTGWGAKGAGADRPGFDSTAYWAGSGLMHILGEVGTPAPVSRGGQGDYPTGLNILTAVLAALRVRDQTDQAQFVEITLQRTGLWSLAMEMQRTLNTPEVKVDRFDRRQAQLATRNSYETGDGRWMMLAMHNVPYWKKFCMALGRPDWAEDPHYVSPTGAPQNQTERIAEIDEIFRSQPLSYWAKQLDDHGCVWSPAATLEEVAQDEQLLSLKPFFTIENADGRGHDATVVTMPFDISGADIRPRHGAPDLGAHTDEVLREAGFTSEQIADYAANGIFG